MGPPVEPMRAIFPRDPNEIARGISPSVVLTRAVAVTVPAAGLVSWCMPPRDRMPTHRHPSPWPDCHPPL